MGDSNDADKTEEVKERLEDDGALGGDTDSDSGTVLTLDGGDGDDEGEGGDDE